MRLPLVLAVTKKFKRYLPGQESVVNADNNPLSYLDSAKLGAMEQRWNAERALFDNEIKYQSGPMNATADTLTRWPSEEPLLKDNEYSSIAV